MSPASGEHLHLRLRLHLRPHLHLCLCPCLRLCLLIVFSDLLLWPVPPAAGFPLGGPVLLLDPPAARGLYSIFARPREQRLSYDCFRNKGGLESSFHGPAQVTG